MRADGVMLSDAVVADLIECGVDEQAVALARELQQARAALVEVRRALDTIEWGTRHAPNSFLLSINSVARRGLEHISACLPREGVTDG